MKKLFLALVLLGLMFLPFTVMATTISLGVDSAPNVYGSPDYPDWWDATKAGMAAGTFVNMANSINPANIGTTNFEIQDEVVYSFGDLGKRLTWAYYIPGETLASLEGRVQVRLENWWDDEYDDFYLSYYGDSWLTPTKLEEYAGGVIGIAGMAWWGAYEVDTPEALAADILEWGSVDETWRFSVKIDCATYSIDSSRAGTAPVPEPATVMLFGIGLLGLAGVSRRKKE